MDQNQRRARIINMRQGKPLPRIRTAPVPDTVLADLDAIDAATDNPTIRAATARIRAALRDAGQQLAGADTEAGRIVAYRLAGIQGVHCPNCSPPPHGDIWTPLTSDDLEPGATCRTCGRGVLIPQEPQSAGGPGRADGEEADHA